MSRSVPPSGLTASSPPSADTQPQAGLVLHACWYASQLHIWAEKALAPVVAAAVQQGTHPAAASAEEIASALRAFIASRTSIHHASWLSESTPALVPCAIPVQNSPDGAVTPIPSPHLRHLLGVSESADDAAVIVLDKLTIPALAIPAAALPEAIDDLDLLLQAHQSGESIDLIAAESIEFFITADRMCQWLLSQQRFVPALVQDIGGGLKGIWQPWLADDFVSQRIAALVEMMPTSARCAIDALVHAPWPILEGFLVRMCDIRCRRVMLAEQMVEAIAGRVVKQSAGAGLVKSANEPAIDPHVLWLSGLLDTPDTVDAIGARRQEMIKRVRSWISVLDQRSSDEQWRLCLRLAEPLNMPVLGEVTAPGDTVRWVLSFHLQATEATAVTISAQDIWVLPSEGAVISGRRVEQPQELLLAELGRAARVYRKIEDALKKGEPTELLLTTAQAYEFLREYRPILMEQGFGVQAPAWWDSPSARLGVRLQISTPTEEEVAEQNRQAALATGGTGPRFGLQNLVNYRWQISLGSTSLSLEEFEKLAGSSSPLVFVAGQWVELRPEDVKAAAEFLKANPGGEMHIGKAIRMAAGADPTLRGLSVLGVEATGWASAIFGATGTSEQQKSFTMQMLDAPPGFIGSLRPYQVKGLSWLAFLDRFGLGSCLADDMGLGKTIQLLAMLLHERTEPSIQRFGPPGPTLLIAPMSVVGNWVRETRRFAPSVKVMVHHGPERLQGQALIAAAREHDLVVSTYALAHRDHESLTAIPWWRIALDEAQNIKNPAAKQTAAVRSIEAPRRVALTGTPIENRLSELWSIMDFLNPGLLGGVQEFRSRYALPIEKYNDAGKGRQLRTLVQPFVLRRLKTDPQVIADLPEKVETKEFCYLTPEQAHLYESTVQNMLAAAEAADGIQRRGVILAGLMKLKQICNHPALFLKEGARVSESVDAQSLADALASTSSSDTPLPSPGKSSGKPGPQASIRSGKATRLVQMLDEVIASSGKALVFTQFRTMGEMLAAMLRHELDREVLLLHGGTSAHDRDELVQRFQKPGDKAPVFILSLKAGGIGLNLTAANHVFHFDRWWNPAVENQATDRAFRIGQTRTVHVHKFVVAGTLEEKIDQMIESKSKLADNVIGSGENWLTELNLNQLREVLTLRKDAVESEAEA